MSTVPLGWLWEAKIRLWRKAISDLMLSSLARLVMDWAWIISSCLLLSGSACPGPCHPCADHPGAPLKVPTTGGWIFLWGTLGRRFGVKHGGMLWILGPWLNSKLGGIWGPLGWKGPKCGGGLLRSGWRVVGGWETPGCKDV